MSFLDDVKEWMIQEKIEAYSYDYSRGSYLRSTRHPVDHVTNVVAYGSDFAEGDTESGFYGDTDVTITYIDTTNERRTVEVHPGDQMGSLWGFMINKWKQYAEEDD